MMSDVSLETCWTIKKHWNNKFYYTVASCWLFLYDLYYDARIHEHQVHEFLGAFGKNCEKLLWASSYHGNMSVYPHAKKRGSHWTNFHEILYINLFFRKIYRKIPSFFKIWQEWQVLYMKIYVHFMIFHWITLRMRNVADKSRGESFFFSENRAVYIIWKSMVGSHKPQTTL